MPVEPWSLFHDDRPLGAWWDDAECSSSDPELFFPGHGDRTRTRAALAVCNRCGVLEQCRDYALERPWLVGIWGGMRDGDRKQWRRRAEVLRAPRNR